MPRVQTQICFLNVGWLATWGGGHLDSACDQAKVMICCSVFSVQIIPLLFPPLSHLCYCVLLMKQQHPNATIDKNRRDSKSPMIGLLGFSVYGILKFSMASPSEQVNQSDVTFRSGQPICSRIIDMWMYEWDKNIQKIHASANSLAGERWQLTLKNMCQSFQNQSIQIFSHAWNLTKLLLIFRRSWIMLDFNFIDIKTFCEIQHVSWFFSLFESNGLQ